MNIENIVKVEIESEGETNGFFTIHLKDGTKTSGWSCDQGSIEMDDRSELPDDVHDLLFRLWFNMDFSLDDWENRLVCSWTPEGGQTPTELLKTV